jgi:hypothetical protein
MTTSSLDRALAASEAWLVEQDAPEAELWHRHEGGDRQIGQGRAALGRPDPQ